MSKQIDLDRRYGVNELYSKLRKGKSFWKVVHDRFMHRRIARPDVREIVRRGLVDCSGSYRVLVQYFNMEAGDYKRFLNFLRKHDCQVDYRPFRIPPGPVVVLTAHHNNNGRGARATSV